LLLRPLLLRALRVLRDLPGRLAPWDLPARMVRMVVMGPLALLDLRGRRAGMGVRAVRGLLVPLAPLARTVVTDLLALLDPLDLLALLDPLDLLALLALRAPRHKLCKPLELRRFYTNPFFFQLQTNPC